MKRNLLFVLFLLLIQPPFINGRSLQPAVKEGQTQVGNTENEERELIIWTPRQHNPAFVAPGGVFIAEVRDFADLDESGWEAILKNDLTSWSAVVESAEWGLIHHDTEPGWKLSIRIPAGISPELMELEILHASGINTTSARSVLIVPDFLQDFYIFHQSDQHIAGDSAVVPGGNSSAKWGNGSKQALEWLTPVVNLTNPRFILYTGDNNQIYNNATDWAGLEEAKLRVQRLIEGTSGYTVPTVWSTGNHDIGWSSYDNFDLWKEQYMRQVGQRAFSFRMGSFYVLNSEWTLTEFLDWAKSDYASSWEDPTVKFRLLAAHFYDGLDGWTTVATEKDPADLMLVGHNHRTRVLQEHPYKVLSVGTAQDHQRAAFYDFKYSKDGWSTIQAESHANGVNVHSLLGDWGTPTVSATYDRENDGTSHSNTVNITNSLPHDFYDGRIRFLMAKGRYTVDGGQILSQYDYDEGKGTAVLVKVNIEADTVTTVSINGQPEEAVPEEKMTWKNVPIGGGGYVTGVVVHPTEPDLIYARTDIGGAYRWDERDKQWIPLLDWVTVDKSNLNGVDGIALDPNNPNIIHANLGKRINNEVGGVYTSEDRGKTWKERIQIRFDANNQSNRWTESLAVDPNNSSVIYVGTRMDGLLRTLDGEHWLTVSDVPKGEIKGPRPLGIRSVAFDQSSLVGNRSANIYIGIPGTGIYHSKDGGETFSPMAGAPDFPNKMEMLGPGALIVTHNKGVALYKNDTWNDITPTNEAEKHFVGLAVDATDTKRVVVSRFAETFNNPIYRTTDGGMSWTRIGSGESPREVFPDVPWWPKRYFSSATSALAMDPHQPGRLFLSDWFGIWQTPDVWADTTCWYTNQNGHEETVALMLASPPEGIPLISLVADVSGFRHENLYAYPTERITEGNEGIDISFCHRQPNYAALIDATSWGGDNTRVTVSSDGGKTWEAKAVPEGATSGKIAYSSDNPENIVYLPAQSTPYYSTDRGETWHASTGAPTDAVGDGYIWNSDHALAADGYNGNRFYLYKSGKIYVTDNRGANWEWKNQESPLPTKQGWHLWITAAPDIEGELWASLGGNGLWRSNDAGTTFNKVDGFDNSRLMGWGKAAPGKDHPTAYVYGTRNDQWGLYRSTDLGSSWTKITDNDFQFGGHPNVLTGDGQVFGRVYVGTGGRGVFYGEPVASN